MEDFYGKQYEMVNTENFDKLLKFLDIGYFQRQVAVTLRPVQHLDRHDDGSCTIYFKSSILHYKLHFTPGVEFDETKPDGNKVRAFITIEGNKIYHRQVEANGRTLNHVYEFYPEKMTLTTTAPGLDHVVKRNYVAVKLKNEKC